MPAKMHPALVAGALTTVLYLHRCLHQRQPGQTHAQAQIHIFAIHKVRLIKAANGLPHRLGQHQARRIDPIDPQFTPA